MVEPKALKSYFPTSDPIQQLRRSIEILDAILINASIKGANFTIEEFDGIITIDHLIDI